MVFTEKELEKKTLSEIEGLILAYEERMKELAINIRAGLAKPAEMMALNSNLAMLKKVNEKKMNEHNRPIQQVHSKAAVPLKSYEDYLKSKKEGSD